MSSETVVSPCTYPRCDDGEGNRRLTTEIMCHTCRRHYRRVLDWLVCDYVRVKTQLPTPTGHPSGVGQRVSPKAKSFGHPAQWASDTTREIAEVMNWIEDALREHNSHAPGVHPRVYEPHVVARAYHYLVDHFEDLCTYPEAEQSADELSTLHAKIRSSRGYFRMFRTLPSPCPSCDVVGYLTIGDGEGTDEIVCDNCQTTIHREMFDFFVTTLASESLDALIAEYDTLEADAFAANLNQ